MNPADEPQDVTVVFGPHGTPRQVRETTLPLSHVVYLLTSLVSLSRRSGNIPARGAFTKALDSVRDEQLARYRRTLHGVLDEELPRGWFGRRMLRRRRERIVEAVMTTVYDEMGMLVGEMGDTSSRLYDAERALSRLTSARVPQQHEEAS